MADKLEALMMKYPAPSNTMGSAPPAVKLGYRLVALQSFKSGTIDPPVNLSWNFLILHHIILEHVLIEYPSECNIKCSSPQNIRSEMNRLLKSLFLVCLDKEPGHDLVKNIKVLLS